MVSGEMGPARAAARDLAGPARRASGGAPGPGRATAARGVLLAVGLAVGCAPRPAAVADRAGPEPAPAPAAQEGPADPEPAAGPGPAAGRACLPVVAAECMCVYPCAEGRLQEDGSWLVRHPIWGETPIRARRDRYCVGGECTEAFLGEILCAAICQPRPADPTCRFAADGSCRSGRVGEPGR